MNTRYVVTTYIAFAVLGALRSPAADGQVQPNARNQRWIATWGSSQQIPEPQNTLPAADLRDATVRQIFHLSAGGAELRVHVSNAFGTEALHFTAVHIARPLSPDSSAIDPATDKTLSFAGAADVTVPPGAEFVSDPIAYSVAPLSNLAVTFHLELPPARETGHPGSRATTWYVHGDAVAAPVLTNAAKVEHWFQVSEIDVVSGPDAASVIALGDSITDGMEQRQTGTTDGRMYWPRGCSNHLQLRRSGFPIRESGAIIC